MNVSKICCAISLLIIMTVTGCSRHISPIVAPEPYTFLQVYSQEKPYAFPLSYFHNKVYTFKTDIVYDTDDTYMPPVPYDSSSYRIRLLDHSTSNDANQEKLLLKGIMVVDSIIEGVNVYKLIVTFDSKRYIVYSLFTNTAKRFCKQIIAGRSYYLELLPYYYPEEDYFNNCGLYYDGYVIYDKTLPLHEWKYVCTTKWIEGINYRPKAMKTK